jgi:hypothetical protein
MVVSGGRVEGEERERGGVSKKSVNEVTVDAEEALMRAGPTYAASAGHYGVEVTESSTNQQHLRVTLSLSCIHRISPRCVCVYYCSTYYKAFHEGGGGVEDMCHERLRAEAHVN